jgi:hypothetical protein
MRKARGFIEKVMAMHRPFMWATLIGMFALSGVVAFLLRFDFSLPLAYRIYLVP